MASRTGSLVEVPHVDGRARNPEPDDAGLVQADECQEQSHTHSETDLERLGDRVGQPGTDPQDGEQGEEHSAQENGAEGGLPAEPHDLHHRVGDERILSHVGRDGEGAFRIDPHRQGPEERAEDRGDHRRPEGDPGSFEDLRVDDDDVRHRDERGHAGHDLGLEVRAVPVEVKVSRERVHAVKGWCGREGTEDVPGSAATRSM